MLALAGCGEDAPQQAAREAVDRWAARHGYESGRAHCTRSAHHYIGQTLRTRVFVCRVPTPTACDEVTAARRDGRFAVTVRRRDVDCVLPAG